MATRKPQRFRGRVRLCRVCKAEIVFAVTQATERGRGGKYMPIDIIPNPEGRVAVREVAVGVLRARPLAKDESHDTSVEVLATPHQATCASRNLVPEVEAFLREQADGGDA